VLAGAEDEQKVSARIKKFEDGDSQNWTANIYVDYPKMMEKYMKSILPETIVEANKKGTLDHIVSEAERAVRIKKLYADLLRTIEAD
jgi:hypothetical protein